MEKDKHLTAALSALGQWPKFQQRLFLEGAVVGIVSGMVSSFFRWSLEAGTRYREYIYTYILENGSLAINGLWFAILLGAAWVLWRLGKYEPNAGGSGIPQVKGIILGALRMKWFSILWVKLVGGILGIGLGLSLGREGPSIQLGAVTAQGLSRSLGRSRMEERYLITAGASAGLAAAFNAPLAGAIFALEELHRNFSGSVLAPSMIAAVLATLVSRIVFGSDPVFHFGALPVLPVSDLWLPVIIGIVMGFGGNIFNAGLLNMHRFYSLPIFRNSYMPIAFALVTAGVLGYVFPYVLGGGNDLINSLHTLPASLWFFVLLLIGKFIFTLISYGCGVPGGFFLPMLVLGALAGSVTGIILIQLGIIPPTYLSNIVVLSMAAFFAASVHSPITGTVLIMEMTASYGHLLPLCLASLVALMVAQALRGKPIYTTLLNRMLAKKAKTLGQSRQRNLLELTVASGSPVEGKMIGRITWPAHTAIVDIKRHSGDLIPDFDMVLRAGDYVYVLTDSVASAEAVRALVEQKNA